MSKSRVALHEVSYERLSEAEKRLPHLPTPMRSGNSKGPVKMWVCDLPMCGGVEYTYSSRQTPVCEGGARWSFSTTNAYDPRIHQPWVGW